MELSARIRLALSIMLSLALSACGGGGGGGPSGLSTPVPTPLPTGSVNEAAFTCPASDTASSAVQGVGAASIAPAAGNRRAQAVEGLLAVSYARQALSTSRAALGAREQGLGAKLVSEYDFPHAGVTTRTLAVAPSQAASIAASLRTQPGVRSVGSVWRRFKTAVTTPYYPSDPYFNGFTALQITAQGGTAPPTYHVAPYLESQTVPGQWSMHAVKLEYAFGYRSLAGGATVSNPNAVGSSSVKIAVIDTGQDTTHPELQPKVVYQKCFITDPNGSQSTSNFTTDPAGHGTDVAGIAAAATGNALGFTAAGGNSALYGYRIYPTPDDSCTDTTSTDVQCSATTLDVAAAIKDAIAQRVNVINLSLGGDSCTNGADPDTQNEGPAITEALNSNIIVVAAAGNAPGPPVEAPACDSGVIAVGGTSLADGQPNGAGNSNGNAASPTEYLASYSSYGTPGASLHSPSAWGIVAPGGDPTGTGDADNLHWIEDIWTSRPFDSKFATTCRPDYGNPGGTSDCSVRIAGTSMATPVVAGAAALILAVSPAYQSPAAMKALLCATADDIGDPNEGCGRLNVYRAMATALNDPLKP